MSRQISSADRVGNSALSTVATLNLANRHGAAGSESGTSVIAALASRAVRDPLTLCDSSALCDAGRPGGALGGLRLNRSVARGCEVIVTSERWSRLGFASQGLEHPATVEASRRRVGCVHQGMCKGSAPSPWVAPGAAAA